MMIPRFVTGLLCLAVAMPAAAFVEPTERPDPGRERPRALIESRSVDVRPDDPSAIGTAAGEFQARYGGEWTFRADARTERFDLIQGSGIAVVPGRGNRLGPDALEGLAMPDGVLTVEALEPRIREFLGANRRLVVPDRGELVLDRDSSLMRDDGRLVSFNYRWVVDGVPVEGAGVFVRMNSGNITQAGASLVGETSTRTRCWTVTARGARSSPTPATRSSRACSTSLAS